MGCLSKIILCFLNKNNNQIHPIEDYNSGNDIYGYSEENIETIPRQRHNSFNSINRRQNTRVNNQTYSDLPIDEIINIINITDNNSNNIQPNQNQQYNQQLVNIVPKKKKSNKTCPICLERINAKDKSDKSDKIICKNKQCRACYHKNCINEWAKTKGTNDISCLLCTLKTIKVKAGIYNNSSRRHNNVVTNVGYYNSQGYYNNSRYQDGYGSNYRINYNIYDNYRPPNTR